MGIQMPRPKIKKCRDCWTPSETDYLGLCEACSGDPIIVDEKIRAAQVTKEIRGGLTGFYRELRQEAKR